MYAFVNQNVLIVKECECEWLSVNASLKMLALRLTVERPCLAPLVSGIDDTVIQVENKWEKTKNLVVNYIILTQL